MTIRMSTLLQARDVTHGVGERTLFSDLEFTVSVGSRVGLVGHNGCGKSTLLDFLAGARAADAGEIIYRRGLKVGRVEQFLPDSIGVIWSNREVIDRETIRYQWAKI